jgi:dihydropteroate synthase
MKQLDLYGPLVMGILNVTPDSFSDGGQFLGRDAALRQAESMLAAGAAIIDVGGESTRPGARSVGAAEEMARVVPVVEMLVAEFDAVVSVDTSKPEVMSAAMAAGAGMINDVAALQADGAVEIVAESGLPVCLMHMQGSPRTMQTNPQYRDVIEDIIEFLAARIASCVAAGVKRERIVIDPGFGFGKTLKHNYRILSELRRFSVLECPLLAGMSRKSMIGQLLDLPVSDRVTASAILAALALERGANILRVHDVGETIQAIKLVEAIDNMREL